MGTIVERDTGKRRTVWALLVTLSCSRLSFVYPTFRQTVDEVCAGLDAAWRFFGGIVARIVVDNLKPVIAKADALSPKLGETFVDYAQARGLFVDAARVRHPKDKPRVENHVRYVRDSWFAGESFEALDEMRQSASTWCRDVAARAFTARRGAYRASTTSSTSARTCGRRRPSHTTCRFGATPRCIPITTSRWPRHSTRCRRATLASACAFAPTARRCASTWAPS
ncbi:MAG: transposase family protein [Myxococcales bacterium]|nr:transposase family protein [Myxococcales bacterium]